MSRDVEGTGAKPEGGTFEAGWLRLREPVDHRSRAEELLGPLGRAWRAGGWRRIADLGAGAGSNLRYLAERLPQPQEWLLVDHDASLLARVEAPGPAVTLSRVVGDLAAEGIACVERVDLVAGAALLDLTSEAWLRRLVSACTERGAGALFTTIYDGTVSWERGGEEASGDEAQARDRRIRELVNDHQRRDKGLGGALGPDAAPVARRLFREAGFDTWLVPGPWVLDQEDAALVDLLLEGWASAAGEQSPEDEEWIGAWCEARKREIRSGAVRLTVGHLDLLALPRNR